MKFKNNKQISCEVEVTEESRFYNGHLYLAIINGELKQVEYNSYQYDVIYSKQDEEYFVDEQENIYDRKELGKIYSVYCR